MYDHMVARLRIEAAKKLRAGGYREPFLLSHICVQITREVPLIYKHGTINTTS